MFQSRYNERRSLKIADIILTPDLRSFSIGDFSRVDALADKGYQAAGAKAAILERLALSEPEWQTYVAQRTARKRSAVSSPQFVQVESANVKRAAALRERLRSFAGGPLHTLELEKTLTNIIGEGRYESFLYE